MKKIRFSVSQRLTAPKAAEPPVESRSLKLDDALDRLYGFHFIQRRPIYLHRSGLQSQSPADRVRQVYNQARPSERLCSPVSSGHFLRSASASDWAACSFISFTFP